MNRHLLIVVAFAILILATFPRAMAISSGTITVDGNPNDWTALSFAPLGTDQAYNINETYVPVSTDLLEGWACRDNDSLYLMMRVRGGYPFNYDRVSFATWINADPGQTTGALDKWDFAVFDAQNNTGQLLTWKDSKWDNETSRVEAATGSPGYLEWKVSLNFIGNFTQFEFMFYTWDINYDYTVNEIDVSPTDIPVFVPEFPTGMILPLFMIASLLAIAAYGKKKRKLAAISKTISN